MNLCRLLARLFLLFSLATPLLATEPTPTPVPGDYGGVLRHAQAAAAEKSWTHARDAYAQLLPLAPDENARRWVQLWLLDATWRADDVPNDWSARQAWLDEQTNAYTKLLQPYDTGQLYDERLVAILTSRSALFLKTNDELKAGADLLAAADALAGFAPTPETKARYLGFIRKLPEDFRVPAWARELEGRLIDHLDRAASLTGEAGERAWFTLQAAARFDTHQSERLSARADRWAAAIRASQGTPFEIQARSHDFIFRIETSYDRRNTPEAPVDLPAHVAAARDLLAALATDTGDQAEIKTLTEKLCSFEQQWTEPWLRVHAPEFLRPGQPLTFTYGTTGYTQLTARLYRHSLESWAEKKEDTRRQAKIRQNVGSDFKSEDYRALAEKLRQGSAKRVQTTTQTLPDSPPLAWHTGALEISPAIEPGFYTLEINATGDNRDDTALRDIVVTSLQSIAAVSPSSGVTLHIFQSADGQPVANQPLDAIIFSGETRSTWNGRLDPAGMANVPLPTQVNRRWNSAEITALVGGQPLVVDNLHYGRWTSSSLVADMILDRELYRPGETVYWKLIVREFADGRFTLAAPETPLQLNFRLLDRSDNEAPSTVSVSLNSFGTAHGQFVIPATARAGGVEIQLVHPANKEESLFSAAFQIDNYIRPPVRTRLGLVSAPSSLRPGSEIIVHVEADYYSGGPVTAAPVTLVCRPRVNLGPEPEIDDPWARQLVEKWLKELEKKSFTGTTDADGGANFRINLPDFIPPEITLYLNASVAPDGSPVSEVSENWAVTAAGFRVNAGSWTNVKPARVGEAVSFDCRVVDGRDLPAVFRGVASLVELRWSEAWLSPTSEVITGAALQAARRELAIKADGDFPKPWKRLHVGYGRTIEQEKKVQTDATGRLQVSFTPEHEGIYQLELNTAAHSDALTLVGNYANRDLPLALLVTDETTTALPIRPGTHLVAPENAVAGQPQRFLGILPEGASTGLFALAGAEGLVTRRVTFPGRIGWITIDQPPAQLAQSTAWLMALENDESAARISFPVADPAKRLAFTLQSPTSESRPGSEAVFTVTALGPTGHPAAAEVAVSISDESVNALIARGDHTPLFLDYMIPSTMGLSKHPQVDGMPADLLLPDVRPGMQFALISRAFLDDISAGYTDYAESGVTTLAPFEATATQDYGYLKTNSRSAPQGVVDNEVRGVQLMPASISVVSREFSSIVLRRFFSSTAAWEPALTTDAHGQAQFNFRYPDNLTRWRIEAYAVGRDGNTFGQASAFTQTSLPFQARLQTPRFLTAGDSADLSAVFVNRADAAQTAAAQLTVEGSAQLLTSESSNRESLALPAQGEAHASWQTQATAPGTAQLTLKARSASESDGMILELPVQPDGFWQETAASARLAGNARQQSFDLELPSPLDPQRVQVELKFSPGIYPALLDVLPYLIDYPYGCVEQTMNRFLPAVVMRKTLVDFGLDAAAVERRILADESQPAATRRKKTAGLTKLDDVVQAGFARLAEARLANGSYGWWPGQQSGNPWMTAYVVWGLSLAHEAGLAVPNDLREEALKILPMAFAEKSTTPDMRAWILAALSRAKLPRDDLAPAQAAFAAAYAARDQLSAHGRACLALASPAFGSDGQRDVILRNLENGAQRSTAAGLGDTVHWGSTGNYWRATDGAVESTALTLLALLTLDPASSLTEPAANWLMLNRRSSGWTNTRDTAFAVLALSAYAEADHQSVPAEEVEIHANGRFVGGMRVTPDSVFASKLTMQLPPQSLRPGKNYFELRRLSGTTTLYTVALTSAWAENTTVKPAGHLVQTTRQFEREQQTPTLAGTLRLVAEPLAPDGSAEAGEKVTAIVSLTLPNELEYLMVEVPKPAGCEPFNPLSGWDAHLSKVSAKTSTDKPNDDTGRLIYREEHDDRSVFFLDHVDAGTWEIRFPLRAITPGDYRAAPVKVEAMYAPEIRANTEARRVKIKPRE